MDLSTWSPWEPAVFAVGGAGALLAALMLVLARVVLPAEKRGRLWFPGWLMVLHVGVAAANLPLGGWVAPNRVLEGLATIFLALAVGRLGLLILVDGAYNRRSAGPMPAIYSDILQGLVFAGVLYFALRSAGVEPTSLFTTSALLTAVVGLALQDTLGNLVAGLAIHAQKPFEVGDIIQFDNDPKHWGRVMEINWRATRVYTDENVEVFVPNGPLAKNWIVNLSRPNPRMRRTLNVTVPNAISPRKARHVLLRAMQDVPGILKDPAPTVAVGALRERDVEYQVAWFVDDPARREHVDAEVRERLWYALDRAGALTGTSKLQEHELRAVERSVAAVEVFKPLTPEDVALLARRAVRRRYMPGDTLIRQGDDGDELFILERGEVRILVGETEVARLAQGTFFGEMSLLTGEKRSATVVAVGHVTALVLGFVAINAVLERTPALAEEFSRVLVARKVESKAAREKAGEHAGAAKEDATRALLQRIRSFFSLA